MRNGDASWSLCSQGVRVVPLRGMQGRPHSLYSAYSLLSCQPVATLVEVCGELLRGMYGDAPLPLFNSIPLPLLVFELMQNGCPARQGYKCKRACMHAQGQHSIDHNSARNAAHDAKAFQAPRMFAMSCQCMVSGSWTPASCSAVLMFGQHGRMRSLGSAL